jgi:SMI1/KNR4 family protein SUKH-1
MEVNGLKLPDAFVKLCKAIASGEQPVYPPRQYDQETSVWMLKEEVDAYGNHFGMDGLDLFCDVETIASETTQLAQVFPPENSADDLFADSPGFIPWILDFSRIVWIGYMGERDPICLNYHDDPKEPSIIYFEDTHWRRVAPNFRSFMDLFEPFDMAKWCERGFSELEELQAWRGRPSGDQAS